MPEPISLLLLGGLLKGSTAAAAKTAAAKAAAAGAAKAGGAGAAKVGGAKVTAMAAKASVHHVAAGYASGAIAYTATTTFIIGTCWATAALMAIASCLGVSVDRKHMSKEEARRYCNKISKKDEVKQERILADLKREPPSEARSVLERHGIYKY